MYINIYHGQCMNAHVLLCSMVYQPHSFPPSISSFIIEIAFAIIWATGTRLAFAMFRSGTTSVRTSEIGKYPDGILPQHGLWTMYQQKFSEEKLKWDLGALNERWIGVKPSTHQITMCERVSFLNVKRTPKACRVSASLAKFYVNYEKKTAIGFGDYTDLLWWK